jgi:hypothetical protein
MMNKAVKKTMNKARQIDNYSGGSLLKDKEV